VADDNLRREQLEAYRLEMDVVMQDQRRSQSSSSTFNARISGRFSSYDMHGNNNVNNRINIHNKNNDNNQDDEHNRDRNVRTSIGSRVLKTHLQSKNKTTATVVELRAMESKRKERLLEVQQQLRRQYDEAVKNQLVMQAHLNQHLHEEQLSSFEQQQLQRFNDRQWQIQNNIRKSQQRHPQFPSQKPTLQQRQQQQQFQLLQKQQLQSLNHHYGVPPRPATVTAIASNFHSNIQSSSKSSAGGSAPLSVSVTSSACSSSASIRPPDPEVRNGGVNSDDNEGNLDAFEVGMSRPNSSVSIIVSRSPSSTGHTMEVATTFKTTSDANNNADGRDTGVVGRMNENNDGDDFDNSHNINIYNRRSANLNNNINTSSARSTDSSRQNDEMEISESDVYPGRLLLSSRNAPRSKFRVTTSSNILYNDNVSDSNYGERHSHRLGYSADGASANGYRYTDDTSGNVSRPITSHGVQASYMASNEVHNGDDNNNNIYSSGNGSDNEKKGNVESGSEFSDSNRFKSSKPSVSTSASASSSLRLTNGVNRILLTEGNCCLFCSCYR
jgi:hypothetical protein